MSTILDRLQNGRGPPTVRGMTIDELCHVLENPWRRHVIRLLEAADGELG